MQSLLDSPRLALDSPVNVCATIECPYFQNSCSASKGCAKYSNTEDCHLTSVFAFKSDHHCLLTANESELPPVKMANDGWIAKEKSCQEQVRNFSEKNRSSPIRKQRYQKIDVHFFYADDDCLMPSDFTNLVQKSQPMSISLLNSIHFEEY